MKRKLIGLFVAMLVSSLTGMAKQETAWLVNEQAGKDAPQQVQLASARDCILRLKELAASDSLPAYEDEAEWIINKKLLWQQKTNSCSVESASPTVKMDLLKLANAWRMGKIVQVRLLLEKIDRALSEKPASPDTFR